MSNPHLWANLGIAAPIHYAAAMVEPPHYAGNAVHALRAPLGAYMAYRAGRDMDQRKMSEIDALFNAGMLANSLTHLAAARRDSERDWAARLTKKMFSQPTKTTARRMYMGAGTLGLGLPLYFYYRQGLKPKETPGGNDNTGGAG